MPDNSKIQITFSKIAKVVRLATRIGGDVVALLDGATAEELAKLEADGAALYEAIKALGTPE